MKHELIETDNERRRLEHEARAGLRALQRLSHDTAVRAGWYHASATGEPVERNFGEVVALMHSELSEALEGDRKNLNDDHLPEFPMAAVEFVDCIIRIADTAAARNYNLGEIFVRKNRYNRERADHKLSARLGVGGKRY